MTTACDIRKIVGDLETMSGKIDGLGDDDDLFERGLDSFGSVQLMLALEEHYGIEFPDHMLNRRSFSTIRIIQETVAALSFGAAA